MTHFQDVDEVIKHCEINSDLEGTVRTSAKTSRFYADHYALEIEALAHSTGVGVELTVRKSFLGGMILITAEGPSPKLATFFRGLQRLER